MDCPFALRLSGGRILLVDTVNSADVLYINFTLSNQATDSELTDDDIIVRYYHEEVIGYTILHASTRTSASVARG